MAKNRCFEETCPLCGRADVNNIEALLIDVEGVLMKNNGFEMRRTKAEMIKALVNNDSARFEEVLKIYRLLVPVKV